VARRRENSTQLTSLLQNILTPLTANDVAIRKHFQPKYRFIRFFHHQTDLRKPFCPRTPSTSRSIVCRNRSAAAQQLFADYLRVGGVWQWSIQLHDSNRESLRSIAQFLGPGGHLITARFSI